VIRQNDYIRDKCPIPNENDLLEAGQSWGVGIGAVPGAAHLGAWINGETGKDLRKAIRGAFPVAIHLRNSRPSVHLVRAMLSLGAGFRKRFSNHRARYVQPNDIGKS
jgi:hypothetical protein